MNAQIKIYAANNVPEERRFHFSTFHINVHLCNLDTTLITHEIWKYLLRVAVIFETIHHKGIFETIHHEGAARVVYGFKNARVVYGFKNAQVVYGFKKTATRERYFHISRVISVVSRLHNEAFHSGQWCMVFFIIHY